MHEILAAVLLALLGLAILLGAIGRGSLPPWLDDLL
jgi:hypothetical protein